jgi:hypothetical protein
MRKIGCVSDHTPALRAFHDEHEGLIWNLEQVPREVFHTAARLLQYSRFDVEDRREFAVAFRQTLSHIRCTQQHHGTRVCADDQALFLYRVRT